ncbi:MAG TPA: DUF3592 domain-containing protein [Chitinophagaceae bacterium]|jgi:hypothetical protein|nr:DUF3592 domain-containing protein [Chitinophagaceae bacterium]
MATHIIIVIMGSVLIYIILQMQSKYRALKNGAKAEGVIDGFETRIQKRATLTIPIIRFTTGQGQIISKASEDSVLSARIKKGVKVTVLYDPENPLHFIAKAKYFNTYSITVLVLSSIFTIFGLILILNDIGLIHLFKQLQRE